MKYDQKSFQNYSHIKPKSKVGNVLPVIFPPLWPAEVDIAIYLGESRKSRTHQQPELAIFVQLRDFGRRPRSGANQ